MKIGCRQERDLGSSRVAELLKELILVMAKGSR